MHLTHLWLNDWRNWERVELCPAADGITVIVGPNGQGKTNLLEAIAWLATLESFRYAPNDAMVRNGCVAAVARAEVESQDRTCLIEGEIRSGRQDRVQLNRQPLRRRSDLADVLRVTVFMPDDLYLVKGGPAGRRRFLDESISVKRPSYYSTRSQFDKVLRQRATLLRQSGGRLSDVVAATLDVWDVQLAKLGTEVAEQRESLVTELEPLVREGYEELAGETTRLSLAYQRTWQGSLEEALHGSRAEDVRRGVNSLGPQRDEMDIQIHGMSARSRASQGEQRSIALALRLGLHRAVTSSAGSAPVLLLDDVFSELDDRRSTRLLELLPPGQVLLASASTPPESILASQTVDVEDLRELAMTGAGGPL